MLLPALAATSVRLTGAEVPSRLGRTLVLAPHPDDETLGCGGLLALLAQAGSALQVVLVTDGAASHPHSRSHGPARLRALRLHEMRCALRELGCGQRSLIALALPDGAVPSPSDPRCQPARQRLARVVERFKPDTVVMPWRGDAHPDHRATQALGMAVCQQWAPEARCLEYVVWPSTANDAPLAGALSAPSTVWHIDIASVVDRKCRALAQHRSQLGQAVCDDPDGFTLPAELLQACAQPFETYHGFEPGDVHAQLTQDHPAAGLL